MSERDPFEQLVAFWAGELPEEQRAAFEARLAASPELQAELRDLEAFDDMAGREFGLGLEEDMVARARAIHQQSAGVSAVGTDADEQLIAYWAGELGPAERAAFERQLAASPALAAELQELQAFDNFAASEAGLGLEEDMARPTSRNRGRTGS